MTALEVHDLHHDYGADEVLKGVSLTLQEGELLAILGPSGCGKTTLLRLAAGLERLGAGRIVMSGEEVASAKTHVAPESRQIGLVLQDFALFPHMTVAANIGFGLRKAHPERVSQVAQMVQVDHLLRSWPHQLSGGEQQRVALARALAPAPRVMLMDEPFSSLDTTLRLKVGRETRTVLKQAGISTVLVTHDPEEALRLADRIAIMRAGRLVQVGTPAEIYDTPADIDVLRLFGETNCLEATQEGQSMRTAFGLVPGIAADGYVWARADAFQTSDGGAACIVEDCRFAGAVQLVDVRLENAERRITCALPREITVAMGDVVHLALNPAKAYVFA